MKSVYEYKNHNNISGGFYYDFDENNDQRNEVLKSRDLN